MTYSIFDPKKFLLIAGPCALESEDLCREVAAVLAKIKAKHRDKIEVVFKASFDKANRTDVHSLRGLGLEQSLEIFSQIKKEYQLLVTTDVHLPEQVERVASVCDVLQIPAFLCRQTDLLQAAAESKRTINVKKGQFLSPYDMKFVVEKLEFFEASEVWQTDRGTTFGYGNLIVDMRSFGIMKQNKCPVIFDATHSLQMPGCGTRLTGGDRQFIAPLAHAALAAGAQGIFLETHPNPDQAWSDKATQLVLEQLPEFVEDCLKFWELTHSLTPNEA